MRKENRWMIWYRNTRIQKENQIIGGNIGYQRKAKTGKQNIKALAAWATTAMLVPGLLTGCGNVSTDSSVTDSISATQSITASNISNTGTGTGAASTSQSTSENLSKAEVTFTFSDSGIEAALTSLGDESTSEKYEIADTSLVIKEAGVYVLAGSCTDGNVKVKKGTTGVVLVLNGLTLTSADTAVIACNKSSQVTIEAAAGSENTLTDSAQNNEDNYPDNENVENAVLKCKDGSQVVLCGTGILNINANGKNGIKSGATTTEEGEASLTIKELTLNITAPVNDAINAEQLLNVESGSLTISAADDAVHCDLVLNIGEEGTQGPSITITECNEGLEGATVNIVSGEIDITASDDCINVANSSLNGYDFEMNISGGTINAYTSNGDGFDSNADMNISGGTVVVWSANSADNEPLDADGTITISGGIVLAAGGGSGMGMNLEASQSCVIFGSDSFGGFGGGMEGGFGSFGSRPGSFGQSSSDPQNNAQGNSEGSTESSQNASPNASQNGSPNRSPSGSDGNGVPAGQGDENGPADMEGGMTPPNLPENNGTGALSGQPDGNGSANTDGSMTPPELPENSGTGTPSGQPGGSSSIAAGDTFTITDASGNVVYSGTAVCNANYLIFSSEEVTAKESYTLSSNDTEIETSEAASGTVESGFSFGGRGGQPGGGRPGSNTNGSTDGAASGSTDGNTNGAASGNTDGNTFGAAIGSADGNTNGAASGNTDGNFDPGTNSSTGDRSELPDAQKPDKNVLSKEEEGGNI